MKKARAIGIVCAIVLALSFVWAYVSVPDTLILYKDRTWKSEDVSKIIFEDDCVETIHDAIVPRKSGDYRASATFLGIPYKAVTVKVLDDDEVILGGQAVGIRLYSDGLVVVATGKISENEISPAEKAGIRSGDVIEKINSEKVGSPEEFAKKIAESEGEIVLEIRRGDATTEINVLPQISEYDNVKKIGLWVRDSTAGVGTLTYIDPKSKTFGALGHAVSDVDTGVRFEVLKGSIEKCEISGIEKGEKGEPGELKGVFYQDAEIIGYITKNKNEGIFGTAVTDAEGEFVKTGHKNDIKKGKAYIRVSLDGINTKDYEAEIVRVATKSKNPSKGICIKITDEELLSKTGGIVQGMSGSPIIQDGKLIGAVTHVLVNQPDMGYGIFIENMLDAAM